MNRYLIPIIIYTFAFPSLALAETTYFEGYYAGLGGGLIQETFRINKDDLDVSVTGNINIDIIKDTTSSDQSPIGNINVGYSKLLNPWSFLAFDVHANFHSIRAQLSMNTTVSGGGTFNKRITLKQISPSYGVAIKPGILVSPQTGFYGVIGGELAKLQASSYASFMMSGTTSSTSGSATSDRFGLLVGAGVESYINEKLTLGFEYNYIDYGKISSPYLVANITGAPGVITVQDKIKTQTNAFIFKITYHV